MKINGTLALALLLLAGCDGGSSPTAPERPNLTGSWSGSYAVTVGGSGTGTVVAQLTHSGSQVTGTGTLDPGTPVASSMTLQGGTSGNGIVLDFFPSVPTICPLRFNGTWTSSSIRGQWVSFNCTASFGGTIEMRR